MRIEYITIGVSWEHKIRPVMPIIGIALDVLFGAPVTNGAN